MPQHLTLSTLFPGLIYSSTITLPDVQNDPVSDDFWFDRPTFAVGNANIFQTGYSTDVALPAGSSLDATISAVATNPAGQTTGTATATPSNVTAAVTVTIQILVIYATDQQQLKRLLDRSGRMSKAGKGKGKGRAKAKGKGRARRRPESQTQGNRHRQAEGRREGEGQAQGRQGRKAQEEPEAQEELTNSRIELTRPISQPACHPDARAAYVFGAIYQD
ncbi:MAG: hypothetical protein U0794_06580 [Isosphaeraceae bacterium]